MSNSDDEEVAVQETKRKSSRRSKPAEKTKEVAKPTKERPTRRKEPKSKAAPEVAEKPKKRKKVASDTEDSDNEAAKEEPEKKKKKTTKAPKVHKKTYIQEVVDKVCEHSLTGKNKGFDFGTEAKELLAHLAHTLALKTVHVAENNSTLSSLKSIKEDRTIDAINEILGGSKKELNAKLMEKINSGIKAAIAAHEESTAKGDKKTSSKKK